MMSFTSSERKGILAIAALALLITGAGLCASYCGRSASDVEYISSDSIEVLVNPADSVSAEPGDSIQKSDKGMAGERRGAGKKIKNPNNKKDRNNKEAKTGKSKKQKRQPKTYRRRSPRDEKINPTGTRCSSSPQVAPNR